jgi:hypothetical protein
VGKFFNLGSGTVKHILSNDRVSLDLSFKKVKKYSFNLEAFGTGFDVLDLTNVAESLVNHLELIGQFGCVSSSLPCGVRTPRLCGKPPLSKALPVEMKRVSLWSAFAIDL